MHGMEHKNYSKTSLIQSTGDQKFYIALHDFELSNCFSTQLPGVWGYSMRFIKIIDIVSFDYLYSSIIRNLLVICILDAYNVTYYNLYTENKPAESDLDLSSLFLKIRVELPLCQTVFIYFRHKILHYIHGFHNSVCVTWTYLWI
jgi:hypothetical protein